MSALRPWVVTAGDTGAVVSSHATEHSAVVDARAHAERSPGVDFHVCALIPRWRLHTPLLPVEEERVAWPEF